jgi:hypothetical protein
MKKWEELIKKLSNPILRFKKYLEGIGGIINDGEEEEIRN